MTIRTALVAAATTLLTLTTAHAQTGPIEGMDGDWSGALDIQGQKLPLIVHIATANGATVATMDSPAQGANGIPISSIARDGDTLTFEIALVAGDYKGEIADDGDTVSGTWSQNGVSLPLALTRD